MKKAILTFTVAALVLATLAIWFFTAKPDVSFKEMASYGVIVLLVAFAFFAGYKKLVSVRRGQPAEDELSKKVMLRSSSFSYFISLYLWLILMYFADKVKFETHTLIGLGILGMAVVFAISWLVFNFRGIGNE